MKKGLLLAAFFGALVVGGLSQANAGVCTLDLTSPLSGNTVSGAAVNVTWNYDTVECSLTDNVELWTRSGLGAWSLGGTASIDDGGLVGTGLIVFDSTTQVSANDIEFWIGLAGNYSVFDSETGVTIDNENPTITLVSRLPAANEFGWNKANVTVTWSCSDALSGVVSPTVSVTKTANAAGQSANATCTDGQGNTSSDTVTDINIDKVLPGITFASQSPAANGAGWNNSDVTLSFNCTDALSTPQASPVTALIDTEGASQSATGTCLDKAGNSKSLVKGGVKLDKTAPSLSFDGQTPAANTNGWNNTDVTFTWSCTDALSGVDVAPLSPQTLTTEGAAQSVGAGCEDVADNLSSDSQNASIDKTKPGIVYSHQDPLANANGWNNSNITAFFTCTDALSGPEAPEVTKTITSEGSNKSTGTATCKDLAGNSKGASKSGFKLDKTAPGITYSGATPAPNGAGWNNSEVTASWTCSDALSGPVASPVTASTGTSEGSNLSLTGTCFDKADNSKSDTQSGFKVDLTAPKSAVNSERSVVLRMSDPIMTGFVIDNVAGHLSTSVRLTDVMSGLNYDVAGVCFSGCGSTVALFTYDTSSVPSGLYFIKARSNDNAGNAGDYGDFFTTMII